MPPKGRTGASTPRTRKLAAVPDEKRGGLAAKVEETLQNVVSPPEDTALRALALEYARTIDRAAAIAADVAKVPFDPESADAIEQLRKRVTAHATMADLGPKLLQALDALGATPKARAAAGKPAPPAGPSKLAALRGEAGA